MNSPIDPVFGKDKEAILDLVGAQDISAVDGGNQLDANRLAIGEYIVKRCKEAMSARLPRDESIRWAQRSARMTAPPRRSPLGEDGANIRTPLTFEQVDTRVAFLWQVVTGVRPYFRTEPVFGDANGKAASDKIEAFYDQFLVNDIGFATFCDKIIREGVLYGTGVARVSTKKKSRKSRAIRIVDEYVATAMGFEIPENSQLQVGSLLQKKDGTIRIGDVVDVDIYEVTDTLAGVEQVSYFRYVQSPVSCMNPEDADIVGVLEYYTVAELKRLARSGEIDGDALTELLADKKLKPCTSDNATNIYDNETKDSDEVTDELDEEESMQSKRLYSHSRIEFVCVIADIDGDGDGIEEDWLLKIETSTGRILYAARSYFNPDYRNIRLYSPSPREESPYGLPLPVMLEGLQIEADEAASMMLDAAAIAMTVIVQEPRSAANKLTPQKIRPGINLRNVDDTSKGYSIEPFPAIGEKVIPSMEVIRQMAQTATAANETMLGSVGGGSKTATETMQAVTAGSRRLMMQASRLQSVMQQVMVMIHHAMMQIMIAKHRGNLSSEIRFTKKDLNNRPVGVSMTLAEFLTPVFFVPHGDVFNTDQALVMQAAEKVFMGAERNPLINGDYVKTYHATRNFLTALGVRNYTDIIGTLEEWTQKQEEADEKAKTAPVPPPFDQNVKAEYMAAFLAENPDKIQVYIDAITQVFSAMGKGGEDNSIDEEIGKMKDAFKSESDKAKQMIALEKDKAAFDIEMDKQRAGLSVQSQVGKAGLAIAGQAQKLNQQERSVNGSRRSGSNKR